MTRDGRSIGIIVTSGTIQSLIRQTPRYGSKSKERERVRERERENERTRERERKNLLIF